LSITAAAASKSLISMSVVALPAAAVRRSETFLAKALS